MIVAVIVVDAPRTMTVLETRFATKATVHYVECLKAVMMYIYAPSVLSEDVVICRLSIC